MLVCSGQILATLNSLCLSKAIHIPVAPSRCTDELTCKHVCLTTSVCQSQPHELANTEHVGQYIHVHMYVHSMNAAFHIPFEYQQQ